MRLKHVKGAAESVEKSSYVIIEEEAQKGQMQSLFINKAPLHIEIGMGKGNFIIENAKKYPHINFIGIEKYDSVIIRAVQKLEEEKLDNLKLIRMDATNIDKIFEKEVDTIYLNFSDPWPKDRHAKRRLSSSTFLKRYDAIFSKEKKIVMKTDNRHLFEYSLMSFTDYGYQIKELSLDLYKDDYPDNIATEYEEKFHTLGYPIYRVSVNKK
ncbi:MAG: tRNA (guanosine(46)-N7)-methyltransferase TrmB [Bacilli bacterium]|nr:tRNA (guanosine(46)-N7)-methyltransferase TrmB [Bacilli bacterium]